MDWTELRGEVRALSQRCAHLLRTAPDPEARVPPTTWTVAGVGAHLLSLPRRYRAQAEDPIGFPGSMSAYNKTYNETIDVVGTEALADALVREMNDFVDFLGTDPEGPFPFYGFTHTAAGMAGIALSEMLLHGFDLATLLGQEWEITTAQALAAIDGTVPTLANFVVPEVAAKAAGTYHLHLRGGLDWTVRLVDAKAEFERGRPTKADLHLSADPVGYLLVGFQRRRQWRALLGGQMVAWGKKPWLALRFSKAFAET